MKKKRKKGYGPLKVGNFSVLYVIIRMKLPFYQGIFKFSSNICLFHSWMVHPAIWIGKQHGLTFLSIRRWNWWDKGRMRIGDTRLFISLFGWKHARKWDWIRIGEQERKDYQERRSWWSLLLTFARIFQMKKKSTTTSGHKQSAEREMSSAQVRKLAKPCIFASLKDITNTLAFAQRCLRFL